jgi:hypothetical protein
MSSPEEVSELFLYNKSESRRPGQKRIKIPST